MKKLLLFICSSIIIQCATAQHWLQPGATYNYMYQTHTTSGYKQLKYVYDTIFEGKICSKLKLQRQHCYAGGGYSCGTVTNEGFLYLMKRNDSVFILGTGTQRFLFNLNPQVGDEWNYGAASGPPPWNLQNITRVDSIRIDTVNGIPLKKIFVALVSGSSHGYTGYITDRFGPAHSFLDYSNMSLFPPSMLANPWYQNLTCYSDSLYPGTFCSSPFVSPISLSSPLSHEGFIISPNPASQNLSIQYSGNDAELRVSDILGKEIKNLSIVAGKAEIDLNGMNNGIYFISVVDKNKILITRKFLVQH